MKYFRTKRSAYEVRYPHHPRLTHASGQNSNNTGTMLPSCGQSANNNPDSATLHNNIVTNSTARARFIMSRPTPRALANVNGGVVNISCQQTQAPLQFKCNESCGSPPLVSSQRPTLGESPRFVSYFSENKEQLVSLVLITLAGSRIKGRQNINKGNPIE